MIEFLTEDVRLRFHLLSIDLQREWLSIAHTAADKGKKVTFVYVDDRPESLEVSLMVGG